MAALLVACALALPLALQGCGATQIDRHGHVFTDVDLKQVQPGMSKDQVRLTLGSPDTTGTVDGDVFYYISSTGRTRPMSRPKIIDRKILAVYFDDNQSVREVANYGLKDGRVFDFIKGTTPTRGRKLSAIQQIFGNIANRQSVVGSQDRPPSAPPGQ